ncbi:hypothetical protein B0I37DRAFT_58922 [Chaetomium sp. MPI-CAGE-AT-0009]|nr:hypothetical protein B0I37DRAFT_58922 [Chaetomium sp. MPI-CAGE-AT-0009]
MPCIWLPPSQDIPRSSLQFVFPRPRNRGVWCTVRRWRFAGPCLLPLRITRPARDGLDQRCVSRESSPKSTRLKPGISFRSHKIRRLPTRLHDLSFGVQLSRCPHEQMPNRRGALVISHSTSSTPSRGWSPGNVELQCCRIHQPLPSTLTRGHHLGKHWIDLEISTSKFEFSLYSGVVSPSGMRRSNDGSVSGHKSIGRRPRMRQSFRLSPAGRAHGAMPTYLSQEEDHAHWQSGASRLQSDVSRKP